MKDCAVKLIRQSASVKERENGISSVMSSPITDHASWKKALPLIKQETSLIAIQAI